MEAVVTAAERAALVGHEPPEVRESRRRAIVRRMQRVRVRQVERERVDLGYRDHGGEG